MATPPGPEADDPRPLTPREQEVLAAIERHLATSDPALMRKMARLRPSLVRFPALSGQTVLIAVLLVIVAGTALSPPVVAAVILTAIVLLVPWLFMLMIGLGERGMER